MEGDILEVIDKMNEEAKAHAVRILETFEVQVRRLSRSLFLD
jgi:hypothetical protein